MQKHRHLLNNIRNIVLISEQACQPAYHYTKVLVAVAWIFLGGVAVQNLASKHIRKQLQPFKKMNMRKLAE
jgi:hypothetical protein